MKTAGSVLIIIAGFIGIAGGCGTVFLGAADDVLSDAGDEFEKSMGEFYDAHAADREKLNEELGLETSEVDKLLDDRMRPGAVVEKEPREKGTIQGIGMIAMVVSFITIIAGIVSFFKPKLGGVGGIVFGLAMVVYANFFSGPIAVLGGIFVLCGVRLKRAPLEVLMVEPEN